MLGKTQFSIEDLKFNFENKLPRNAKKNFNSTFHITKLGLKYIGYF